LRLRFEWESPRLIVVEELAETFAANNEDAIQTEMVSAPRPPRIIDCFVGPSLLADPAIGHFADHQPDYRREEIANMRPNCPPPKTPTVAPGRTIHLIILNPPRRSFLAVSRTV